MRSSFLMMFSLTMVLSAIVGCGGSGIETAGVSGTITVNGKPVEGIEVMFTPDAKLRPSIGMTDAQGRYKAEFVASQSGVPLGPCVVQFSIYRGDSMKNYLPKEFNEKAADNPAFHLDVKKGGAVFDYDIKYNGEIPPYEAPR